MERRLEPVSVGVPFPRGLCTDTGTLGLRDGAGRWIPAQWEVLSRWPDGSVRWALLDFLATVLSPGEVRVQVEPRPSTAPGGPASTVRFRPHGLEVDNGAFAFAVAADGTVAVRAHGAADAPSLVIDSRLTTTRDEVLAPGRCALTVETSGPVRTTLRAAGEYRWGHRRQRLRYEARISVYDGSGALRMDVVLHNPSAARHRGGLWDLGDRRSVLFRDFTVRARLCGRSGGRLAWKAEPDERWQQASAGAVEIYQDSSGGDNWRSRNHVNRHGEVPLRFRGYRVRHPGGERDGRRASPLMSVTGAGFRLVAAIEQFWQNFPKAVEGSPAGIELGLFPRRFADGFELQAGERKTHGLWFDFAVGSDPAPDPLLDWAHDPLLFSMEPAWHAASGTLCASTAPPGGAARTPPPEAEAALESPSSFHAKREVIDEYGWRNFGEVYADHENAFFRGVRPVVSHYNNQYDLVGGFLTQYVLTGDRRWYELGCDLARHVLDIDRYHTAEDRAAYNGGLFWHTDHYEDAHRATHRTYSADSPRAGGRYGGGPSNEHNYTSGLLLFHHLTGSRAAREAVVGLAEWVLAMDDGRRTLLGVIDDGPTGAASATSSVGYHGPGRGAGNSINALLDAFDVDGHPRFLEKAEELLRRCIHPRDDIDGRGLGDLEARWSYLVFLQALGKYLELKAARQEFDEPFLYARASLLAYARWMRAREVPYRQVLDRVEYPTETWPAHDLRKSVVFGFAARHADPAEAAAFREAAERFRAESLAGLADFETRSCTRPQAIVLQNEPWRAWLMAAPLPDRPPLPEGCDFGAPRPFAPQRVRVLKSLRRPGGLLAAGARLASPPRLLALLRACVAQARMRWP